VRGRPESQPHKHTCFSFDDFGVNCSKHAEQRSILTCESIVCCAPLLMHSPPFFHGERFFEAGYIRVGVTKLARACWDNTTSARDPRVSPRVFCVARWGTWCLEVSLSRWFLSRSERRAQRVSCCTCWNGLSVTHGTCHVRVCVCNRAAMAHTRWLAVGNLPNLFFSCCAIAAFAHLR
jgi:hypothetical protein